ncbi:MAG: Hint domain-containing protein, partial [Pseudooceanicola nanhaiensis]
FPDVLRDDDVRGRVYTPFTEFTDGDTVFEITPPSSIEVFHLCLAQHATIQANGLPVESFHPGYHIADGMGPNKLALFLSLFPHITALRDFGLLAHPRMTLQSLMRLDAA